MVGDRDITALASYLAERDAPCPHCRYNLRGVEARTCPECGGRLELGLVRRPRLLGWGPFLVLVFAWLLIAGGINATREVRRLVEQRRQVVVSNQRVAAMRVQLQAQMKQAEKQLEQFDKSMAPPDDFFGSAEFRRFQQQAQRDMQAMRQQMLQQQLAALTPKAQPTPTLTQIWLSGTAVQRGNSMWAGGLALAGLLGLLILMVWRIRRPSAESVRVLVGVAMLLFVVYAGWHVMLFVREMV